MCSEALSSRDGSSIKPNWEDIFSLKLKAPKLRNLLTFFWKYHLWNHTHKKEFMSDKS